MNEDHWLFIKVVSCLLIFYVGPMIGLLCWTYYTAAKLDRKISDAEDILLWVKCLFWPMLFMAIPFDLLFDYFRKLGEQNRNKKYY